MFEIKRIALPIYLDVELYDSDEIDRYNCGTGKGGFQRGNTCHQHTKRSKERLASFKEQMSKSTYAVSIAPKGKVSTSEVIGPGDREKPAKSVPSARTIKLRPRTAESRDAARKVSSAIDAREAISKEAVHGNYGTKEAAVRTYKNKQRIAQDALKARKDHPTEQPVKTIGHPAVKPSGPGPAKPLEGKPAGYDEAAKKAGQIPVLGKAGSGGVHPHGGKAGTVSPSASAPVGNPPAGGKTREPGEDDETADQRAEQLLKSDDWSKSDRSFLRLHASELKAQGRTDEANDIFDRVRTYEHIQKNKGFPATPKEIPKVSPAVSRPLTPAVEHTDAVGKSAAPSDRPAIHAVDESKLGTDSKQHAQEIVNKLNDFEHYYAKAMADHPPKDDAAHDRIIHGAIKNARLPGEVGLGIALNYAGKDKMADPRFNPLAGSRKSEKPSVDPTASLPPEMVAATKARAARLGRAGGKTDDLKGEIAGKRVSLANAIRSARQSRSEDRKEKLLDLKGERREAKKTPIKSVDVNPEHENQIRGAFDRLNSSGENNVNLRSLRNELPHISKPEFDAAINKMRGPGGTFALDSHEGLLRPLTRSERRATIDDAGHNLSWVSARSGGQVSESPKVKMPDAPVPFRPSAGPAGTEIPPESVKKFHDAFEAHDRASGGNNFVTLAKMRASMPELSREQFDKLLRHARLEHGYSLDSHEGLHGVLTPEEKAASIDEVGSRLVYLSKRDYNPAGSRREGSASVPAAIPKVAPAIAPGPEPSSGTSSAPKSDRPKLGSVTGMDRQERARRLMARMQKAYNKSKSNFVRNSKQGTPEAVARAEKHAGRAKMASDRMEKIAPIAGGAKWTNSPPATVGTTRRQVVPKAANPPAVVPSASKPLTDADIHSHVENLKGSSTNQGLVPIHAIRAAVRKSHGAHAASNHVFNTTLKRMRSEGKLQLLETSDNRDFTERQLEDSIPGLGSSPHLAYVDSKHTTPSSSVAPVGNPRTTPPPLPASAKAPGAKAPVPAKTPVLAKQPNLRDQADAHRANKPDRATRLGIAANRAEGSRKDRLKSEFDRVIGSSKKVSSPSVTHPDGPEFAARVHVAAGKVGSKGRFGHRVFISHAHAAYEKAHGPISLDEFKAKLTRANNERHLDLGRADLVEAMNPDTVAKSQTYHFGSEYHFIKPPAVPTVNQPDPRDDSPAAREARIQALQAKYETEQAAIKSARTNKFHGKLKAAGAAKAGKSASPPK